MSGWIKLHRQMIDWEWYSDINVMRLFTHCLLRANHKAKQWRGININRGQFYTSLDTLSDETGLSAMQLRTCFSKLEITGEVTSLGMARGRMITVVQYDEYQDDNRLSDKLITDSQQAGNRVVTTNKNVNNEKNNNTSSSEAIASCPHDEIVKLYHSKLPALRQIKVWSDKRKKSLRARWRENPKHQSLEFWDWYFGRVSSSQFLMGNVNSFQADLEWLINPTNFIKVVEGKYDE